jgi:hypothetical protein
MAPHPSFPIDPMFEDMDISNFSVLGFLSSNRFRNGNTQERLVLTTAELTRVNGMVTASVVRCRNAEREMYDHSYREPSSGHGVSFLRRQWEHHSVRLNSNAAIAEGELFFRTQWVSYLEEVARRLHTRLHHPRRIRFSDPPGEDDSTTASTDPSFSGSFWEEDDISTVDSFYTDMDEISIDEVFSSSDDESVVVDGVARMPSPHPSNSSDESWTSGMLAEADRVVAEAEADDRKPPPAPLVPSVSVSVVIDLTYSPPASPVPPVPAPVPAPVVAVPPSAPPVPPHHHHHHHAPPNNRVGINIQMFQETGGNYTYGSTFQFTLNQNVGFENGYDTDDSTSTY